MGFTTNSDLVTLTNLTPQQDYQAFMTGLGPNMDPLALMARVFTQRTLRLSDIVQDQANVVASTNNGMSELHDLMSAFNTALAAASSKGDTDWLTVFTGTQAEMNATAALLDKYDCAGKYIFGNNQIQMQKQNVTSCNQNLQLKVDDATSLSQEQQTKAQSYMNKYSSVSEAASAGEKKYSDLANSIIASWG